MSKHEMEHNYGTEENSKHTNHIVIDHSNYNTYSHSKETKQKEHNPHMTGHHLGGHVSKNAKHHHHYMHTDADDTKIKGDIEATLEKKDPLLIYEAEVAEDYYALCWCALKKDIWENKSVYGVEIFLTQNNYFRIIVDFIIFTIIISFTITVMLYQTFTQGTFKMGNWRIEVLRILIVGFAQKLLFGEIHKGATKFRFSLRRLNEFNYPYLALFIPFWQILMSVISYCLIVIFMCVSNEALALVMHFAEVAILIELDDWIGEDIIKEYPDEGEKPEDVDVENLNEEMPYTVKLSLVREDLKIISDLNVPYESAILRAGSFIFSYFPFYLLPLISTLCFEYVLKYYQPEMIKIIT